MSIRVHELAKELQKSNKEIISFLSEKNIETKSHMSMLSDSQEEMARKGLAHRAAAATTGDAGAQPKKKKIIAVYNEHNSRTGLKDPRKAQPARPQQQRTPQPVKREEKPVEVAAKPAETVAATPVASTPVAPTPTAATPTTQTQSAPAPTGGAPTQNRPQGQRPYNNQNRDGQRPYNNQNRDGQRPYNNQNRDGQRPYNNQNRDGQRPYNNQNRDGAPRPYNNQNRDGAPRPYNNQNRDGAPRPYNNQNRDGAPRPYNNQNRDGAPRPYNNQNRDGAPRPYNNQNRDGQRPYNNNGGGARPYNNNGGGARPYNNNGGGARPYNRDGGRPAFDKDSDNKDQRFQPKKRPERSSDIPAGIDLRKTENRRVENKGRNDDSKKEKNTKFNDNWSGRPNSGPNSRNNRNNRGGKNVVQNKPAAPAPKKEDLGPKIIEIPEIISIHDLAEKMKIQPSVIIKKLFLEGKLVTVNSEMTFDEAGELAMEMNFDPVAEVREDVIAKMLEESDDLEETLVKRAPVVCVMGHVDHGKTSLLDAIRDTHVIDREAGGITQHIGAYVVKIDGEEITFLDTPGHEAFTAMRMRGANSTDIAILVVAADDGVMPQTVEAINHAKAAGIEIIVAVNKIDKPGANIDRVKQELAEHELICAEWGGSTTFVEVSAKQRQNIDELLEMVLLTAEVLELKSNPNRRARGLVIEAELDKGKGPVATVLVQKGTLHVGDFIAVGACNGKVRAMMDDLGRRVKEAGPSTPVEILGLNDVPVAGEIFVSPETDKEAKIFAETYVNESREKMLEDTKLKMSLDDLYSQIKSGNLKELNIIVKADVQGSVEAVKQSLLKLSNEEVVVKIIHNGVGAINESDVNLASASGAIIIGFNVRPDVTAKEKADQEKVDLRLYRVIYDAINDVERAMKGMLDPIFEEKVLGHAEVRQIFKASGVGNIAGSYVLDGMFQRGCSCRIKREGELVFEGELASLKRFKDDVKEVKTGYECGLVFEKFNDIKELDIVEAYTMVEVPR